MEPTPFPRQPLTDQERLNAHAEALKRQLDEFVQQETRHLTAQRTFYTGLMAFMLCFFAVILFLSSKQYNDLTLWGIGLCLLVFGLIHFLEIDFYTSKKSFLRKLLGKK